MPIKKNLIIIRFAHECILINGLAEWKMINAKTYRTERVYNVKISGLQINHNAKRWANDIYLFIDGWIERQRERER